MEVVSHSPLPVSSIVWQPQSTSWVFTFATKATFQLQPGKSTLAPTQLPIHEEDKYWDDDPARSLYAPSDMEPLKTRVDIVLVGSAYAPQGSAVRSLISRLAFGEIDKSIEVCLDRSVGIDNTLIDGQRFARMPLAYERAAGGPDTTNPVGMRLDQRDMYGRLKLPNLLPVGIGDTAIPAVISSIGFGPVAPKWPMRLGKLGRHAAVWSRQRIKSSPMPDDFDYTFFNVAPPDQQMSEVAEETRLVLENLHPQVPRLVTNFSALRPQALVERRSGNHAVKMRCDMLWIDTDHGVATMTFRGQVALDSADEPGRVIVTLEESTRDSSPSIVPSPRITEAPAVKPGPPGPPPASRPMARTLFLSPEDEGIDTIVPQTDRRPEFAPQNAPALPFASKAPTQPVISEERTYSGIGLPFAATAAPPRDERSRAVPSAGLPFVQTGSWPAASVPGQTPQAPVAPAPPVPPARSSVPGRLVSPSSAVPPVPQGVPGIPQAPPIPSAVPVMPQPIPPLSPVAVKPQAVPPIVPTQPSLAPPLPVNKPAVPPPLVPQGMQGAQPSAASDSSVWASGGAPARADSAAGQTSGQTMGQLAAAAAATAAQAAVQDGSSGVIGASNAAAANTASLSKREDKPSGSGTGGPGTSTTGGVRASSKLDVREVLHLIWYQPDSVARICKVPVWRSIIQDMEGHASDDELDDPAPNKDPIEIEDTRDIFEILVRAASQDIDQLSDELQSAVRPGGKFVPSLLLLAGEIVFPFEERETLKATVAATSPMVGNDEPLKAAIKDARDFLNSPDQLCPGSVIDGYVTRIRDAYQRARRAVSFDQLEAQVERVLLEGRCYQKRQVLGMNAIRALLCTGTGSSSVRPAPLYLPEDIAKKLPLFQRFRARVIVELYMQEDQYEQHAAALKALALGRIQVPQDGKRG